MASNCIKLPLSLASALLFLATAALAQAPPPGDVRRLGQPISLASSSTLTVTREDPQAWRSGYPEFKNIKGILVAFRLQFKGTYGFSFGTDYEDASKSDIALRCGNRWFNFDKMAAVNPETGRAQIGSSQNAGGVPLPWRGRPPVRHDLYR